MGPIPYKAASQACSAVGKVLADPYSFSESLNLLSTLSHLWDVAPPLLEQLFWVQSSTKKSEAVNLADKLVTVNNNMRLPAICTQSAPFSNGTTANTDERWQVRVNIANSTITGFGCPSFLFFLFSFFSSPLGPGPYLPNSIEPSGY
jgi:hypothetical protein